MGWGIWRYFHETGVLFTGYINSRYLDLLLDLISCPLFSDSSSLSLPQTARKSVRSKKIRNHITPVIT